MEKIAMWLKWIYIIMWGIGNKNEKINNGGADNRKNILDASMYVFVCVCEYVEKIQKFCRCVEKNEREIN